MRIHYNNGKKDKIIDNVLSIQIIDGNQPVTVLMANGKELTVSLNNIEMILDERVFEKPKEKMTNKEFWLNLFSTNDVALIGAITLCRRFAPKEGEPLKESELDYILKQKEWLQREVTGE